MIKQAIHVVFRLAGVLVLFIVGVTLANAQIMTSLLGDKDGFGFGLQEGDIRPVSLSPFFFDNRDSNDPFFTDVEPITVQSCSANCRQFSYTHIFQQMVGPIGRAELKLFTIGIQDGDSQVLDSVTDIKIYLNNMEVLNAFDDVDQFGSIVGEGFAEIAGSVTITVPKSLLPFLADGLVEVRFEILQLGTTPSFDAFAIDFSELEITSVTVVLLEELIDDVLDLNLPKGLERGLIGKLNEAIKVVSDDNTNNDHVAVKKLEDFMDQIYGQRGKRISETDADFLIAQANEIILLLLGVAVR